MLPLLALFAGACPAFADNDGVNLLQMHAVAKRDTVDQTGPGEDAVKFCAAERLVLNNPSVNNLDGSNAAGEKVIRYPGVKSGVDLIIEAGDDYVPANPSLNGLKDGFGRINMKVGTGSHFKFTFVSAGTSNPVVLPAASITLYDLDEGKRGRGRSTIESCGTAASFIPVQTELAQQFKGDCVKTTTCKWGKKKNEPPNPTTLNDDHLARAITMSYEQTSSFTIRWDMTHRPKGRNLQFALEALAACAKTTTTTTSPIPTTQPDPDCPTPNGPYKFCNCREDPNCDTSFLQGIQGAHKHAGMGIFWAAKNKNGDGVQVWQAPYTNWQGSHITIAIIAGVAVKVGNDIVTYSPTTFKNNNGIPKVMVNNQTNDARTVKQKLKTGYVSATGRSPVWSAKYGAGDSDTICVGDDARTFRVSVAKRDPYGAVEFHWKINMLDSAIDDTNLGGGYGQICLDGAAYDGQGGRVENMQRVSYNQSFFSYQVMDEICNSPLMKDVGRCDDAANHLSGLKHPVKTNEDLCEELDVPWADAQAACAGITRPLFLEACLFEFCNDRGAEDAKELAQLEEENLQAEEEGVAESHEQRLNFKAQSCCPDDPSCSDLFYDERKAQ